MKKKISIVAAGIILAMSMLAGCSGKTTDGQQAETSAVQTTEGQTEKTGAAQTDSQTDAAAENESEVQRNSTESESSAKEAEETIPNQDVEFEE